MKGLIEALGHYLYSLRELVFPRHCLVCGELLPPSESDICCDCYEDMPLTYFWDWAQNPAFERMSRGGDFHAAASLFFFRETAGYNHLLHSIKYGGNIKLGRRLGRMLGEKLSMSNQFNNADCIVPVPLHPLRRFRRGYNQAMEIAVGMSEAMGIPVEPGLVHRCRYTRTQTRLHGQSKTSNVKAAFRADSIAIKKLAEQGVRQIIVVDDVMTSGATLTACASTLLGHFKISVASLAFVE